jgi:hypothetical protein
MKKLSLFLIIIILFSCKKNDKEIFLDNRCTNYVINDLNNKLLTDKQTDSAQYLFDKNGLNGSDFQFYDYRNMENNWKSVSIYQFANNLKIFDYGMTFIFFQDSLVATNGSKITRINLPNSPTLDHANIRGIFINEVMNDDMLGDSTKNAIANSCIDMELGYWDLTHGTEISNNFALAWFVNSSIRQYPIAFIDDRRANLMFYTNGIIINKK